MKNKWLLRWVPPPTFLLFLLFLGPIQALRTPLPEKQQSSPLPNPKRPIPHKGKVAVSWEPGFLPNLGQWRFPARYWSRKGNMDCFVLEDGWILDLKDPPKPQPPKTKCVCLHNPKFGFPEEKRLPGGQSGTALKFTFLGANPDSKLTSGSPLPGYYNFFLGNDPSRWRSRVKSYEKIQFIGLYPGIDMELKWGERGIVFDFLLAPGADLGKIRLRIEGCCDSSLTGEGALRIQTSSGTLLAPPPSTFSLLPGGKRKKEACAFIKLAKNTFGFFSRTWDRRESLHIDPDLYYSSFIGGTRQDGIVGSVNVGKDRYIFWGGTVSPNFPTTIGAFSRLLNKNGLPPKQFVNDVVLFKMDLSLPGKKALIWSTFFGGSKRDWPTGSLVLDSKEPKLEYQTFLDNEIRYRTLIQQHPEAAKELFKRAAQEAKQRYQDYKRMSEE